MVLAHAVCEEMTIIINAVDELRKFFPESDGDNAAARPLGWDRTVISEARRYFDAISLAGGRAITVAKETIRSAEPPRRKR